MHRLFPRMPLESGLPGQATVRCLTQHIRCRNIVFSGKWLQPSLWQVALLPERSEKLPKAHRFVLEKRPTYL